MRHEIKITIKNINDNITHIISLLDPNVTTQTPSPEIGEETSQKNDAITISPQNKLWTGHAQQKHFSMPNQRT